MTKRSLLNRAKISQFQKGNHDNVIITGIDIKDRKGQNGPINKMIYIKFAQLKNDKRVAESELAWWKPDPTSEYFVTNLQEMCLQLHNLLEVQIGEEAAFEAFKGVFNDLDIANQIDIHNKKWKQSEVNKLNDALKQAFKESYDKVIADGQTPFRLKLTTNYKGEGVEIPKYGKFVEPMDVEESSLKFTSSELKAHSKAGIVSSKPSSSTTVATI